MPLLGVQFVDVVLLLHHVVMKDHGLTDQDLEPFDDGQGDVVPLLGLQSLQL